MALVTCKECSSPVSTQARACPRCGAPVPISQSIDKPRSLLLWLGLPMLALVIGSVVVADFDKKRKEAVKSENLRIADQGLKASMSPAEFAEYKALEADIERRKAEAADEEETMKNVRHLAQLSIESDVKRILRDPESAKFGTRQIHANPKAKTGFSACGYVNAKNSLGGYTGNKGYIVTDMRATLEDGSAAFAAQWRELCF